MKKIIFTQSGANENEVCLKDLNDDSIVGVQYEKTRGLVLKTNENEFKIFSPYYNTDLTDSYSKETLEEYLEDAREYDVSYLNCVSFENIKEAITWLNDF